MEENAKRKTRGEKMIKGKKKKGEENPPLLSYFTSIAI